jgi:Putative DNA-binding domain
MAEPLQHWPQDAAMFASSLLDPHGPVPAFLTSSSGINDPRRYTVYRNNVAVSLIRALAANFPSIERLLGEEFFTAMAHEFLTANPPRSKLMFEYGAEFPAFLEAFGPARPYPYLADVARLEIFWREAFHETNAPVLDGAALAVVSPDEFPHVTFIKHPATRILTSTFAAGSIFAANRKPAEVASIDPAIPETVLVTRPLYDCEVRILEPGDDEFFSGLLDGNSIKTAVEAAYTVAPLFDLPAAIGMLIASGTFSATLSHDNDPRRTESFVVCTTGQGRSPAGKDVSGLAWKPRPAHCTSGAILQIRPDEMGRISADLQHT